MSTEFNIGKGRANELIRRVVSSDPVNCGLLVVLLKTAEADAVLEDYLDLAAVLSAVGNVEADFDGYIQKPLSSVDLTLPVVDNTANTQTGALPAIQWGSAGSSAGGTNNTITKVVVSFCPNITAINLADCVPLSAHDITRTTNGNNLNLNAGVFLIAS